MRPLDGLFVLDFSTLLPGPMATLLLAEVVKIERPNRGEEMRSYAPKWGRDSINFALLNRGKKSVALDLKSKPDLVMALDLVQRADVLVEQFRPGVMDKLGLGHEALAKLNPKLIYCSISGYGQTGPNRDKAGHDLNYIGDAGLLSLAMGAPEHPTIPPALIADLAGGAYPVVMNILLALESRRRTGLGCRLDIAMTENPFQLIYWAIGNGEIAGQWPSNGGELVTGGSPRYRLYDPHFAARGVFEHRLKNEEGRTTSALPTPIAALFRGPPYHAQSAPPPGANNSEIVALSVQSTIATKA